MTLLKTINLVINPNRNEINLTVQPGQRWAILGKNGSGKSTLLQTLVGLHPKINGQILLNGQPLSKLAARQIAKTAGILFQEPRMHFPQSTWQYCYTSRYAHLNKQPSLDKEIIHQALEQVSWPHDLNRCVTTLSGGEKKRLAIAKLLAQQPDLYLLDEPTNHLDVHHQINILSHLKQLTLDNKHSFIMATHDMNIAQQFCNHVLLFYPDKRIEAGPCATLLNTDNLSELYQQPIICLKQNNMIYWTAMKVSSNDCKEKLCRSKS